MLRCVDEEFIIDLEDGWNKEDVLEDWFGVLYDPKLLLDLPRGAQVELGVGEDMLPVEEGFGSHFGWQAWVC